jgi:hypothetical protein
MAVEGQANAETLIVQQLERSLRCVLVANRTYDSNFPNASERMGCYVGAVWSVAKVFGQQLFAPVRRGETRLNRYLRNGESPNRILLHYLMDRVLRTSMFVHPDHVSTERIWKVTSQNLVLSFSGKCMPPSVRWRSRPRGSTRLRLR